MGFSPCCCSLQSGTKAISIFEMVMGVLVFGGGLFLVIGGSVAVSQDEGDAPIGGVAIGLGAVIVILSILRVLFGVLLYQAARDLNEKKCRIWIIISGILLVIGIINLIVSLATGGILGLIGVVGLALEAYFIWVVVAFRNEILEKGAPQQYLG